MSNIKLTPGVVIEEKTLLDLSDIMDNQVKVERSHDFISLKKKLIEDNLHCIFNIDIHSYLSDDEDGLYISWVIYESVNIGGNEDLNKFYIKGVNGINKNSKLLVPNNIIEYSSSLSLIIEKYWKKIEHEYQVNIMWITNNL
jgi:hypothetical protein